MPETVYRWAGPFDTNGLNPGAGIGVGRAETPRTEKEMKMGSLSRPAPWHPTVLNLVVLILLEMVAYALLRYAFRTAHGG
jgi:hypothetical protein